MRVLRGDPAQYTPSSEGPPACIDWNGGHTAGASPRGLSFAARRDFRNRPQRSRMSMLESVAESTETVVVLPQEVQGCRLPVWRLDSGRAKVSLLPQGGGAQCEQSGGQSGSGR